MKIRLMVFLIITVLINPSCFAQKKKRATVIGAFCEAPKLDPTRSYDKKYIDDQPDKTADLPTVVQMVEQALKCYQALSGDKDPMHPAGMPKLSSAVMDFKTTTGKTIGFSIAVYIFKIGASREKDVTDDLQFTYSVKKNLSLNKSPGFAKPTPSPLFEELVKEIQAASLAARSQSTALGLPLSKVQLTVAYGIKFDGNAALNVPIELVTISGNGDYNKNNIQTITLTYEDQAP